MNVNLLIDHIVRQTMLLVAQLATTAGMRAPLAQVANQVFLDLVENLSRQGLSRKVIADMFGISLRAYHARVQRLREGATDPGSLWENIYRFITESAPILRVAVLHRFRHDNELIVRGILRDLVESGLVFRTGRSDSVIYRAANTQELAAIGEKTTADSTAMLVWVAIDKYGPISRQDLESRLSLDGDAIEAAVEVLVSDQRVAHQIHRGKVIYHSNTCVIPLSDSTGWEAAVFDHFQTVATTIASKLAGSRDQLTGGCTFEFEIWGQHPEHESVVNFLERVRKEASELRTRCDQYRESAGTPDDYSTVQFYAGQNWVQHDDSDDS